MFLILKGAVQLVHSHHHEPVRKHIPDTDFAEKLSASTSSSECEFADEDEEDASYSPMAATTPVSQSFVDPVIRSSTNGSTNASCRMAAAAAATANTSGSFTARLASSVSAVLSGAHSSHHRNASFSVTPSGVSATCT